MCSTPFSLDHLDDLSRHSANFHKKKVGTDEESIMSLAQFFEHINEEDIVSWQQKTVPCIHRLIIETLLCAEDSLVAKTGCCELYGFDITLDQWMHPWLLDVNLNPTCPEKAPWLTEILDCMATGLLDIILEPSKQPEDPLYSTELEPNRCAKTGPSEWEYLYKADWLHMEHKPTRDDFEALKMKGVKTSMKMELKMELNHFKKLANVFI